MLFKAIASTTIITRFLSLLLFLSVSSLHQVAATARDDQYQDFKELIAAASSDDDRLLQSISQIRQNVNKAIDQIKKDISDGVQDFTKNKSEYRGKRKGVIKEKRDTVDRFLGDTKKQVNALCGDRTNKYGYYSSFAFLCLITLADQVADAIIETADELRLMTSKLADEYLISSVDLIEKLEQSKQKLNIEKTKIDNYIKKTSHSWNSFKKEETAIKAQLSNVQKHINQLRGFKRELEGIVYGTMCFDVIGATSKIDTPSERDKFMELTRDAMELACGVVGADADLVIMKIVKQKFLITNNRRKLDEKNSISEDPISTTSSSLDVSSHGLRGLKRRGTLRIGTLIGILCNCVDDAPVSDVWNSHRKLGLDKGEKLDEQHPKEDGRTHDDNQKLVVHEDVFFAEHRELLGTELQQKYIEALHESLNRGPLSGVVEVKQIPCEGFLSMNEALRYIHTLS